MNSLCSNLVRSKIGIALESGWKTSNKSKKRVKTGDPRACTCLQEHPHARRTCRGTLRAPMDVDLPLEYFGRDTYHAGTGGRFRVGLRVVGLLQGVRVGFLGQLLDACQRRCQTRLSTECLTRVPLVARRVSFLSDRRVSVADRLSLSNFQIPVKFHINLFIFDFFLSSNP